MTREEAIKHFESYIGNDCYTQAHQDACRMAVDAIRIQQEGNPPLPLDELRKMNEVDVWVAYPPTLSGDQLIMHALVEYDEKSKNVWFTNNLGGRSIYDDVIEDGAVVYRCKPDKTDIAKISCHCIANTNGTCVAEVCKGPISGFDLNISSPEQAKQFYETAVIMFDKSFPDESTQPGVRTNFDRIKSCTSPEDMALELDTGSRHFCPRYYGIEPKECQPMCKDCIADWLKKEEGQ